MRLLVCCVCIAAAATSVHSESIETGLQNPVLRAHFRSYLLNATSGQGGGRGRGRGPTYRFDLNTLERNVDRLAFHFLMEVSEKVADLKHTYTEVVTLRESLIRSEFGSKMHSKLLTDWKERFDDLEDRADDLKDTISRVLPWVKSKTDFKPELDITPGNPAFEREVAYIGDQINQAEQRIRDFFFTPTHTVTVTQLTEDNVLIQLFRVEKLSKKIKTSL